MAVRGRTAIYPVKIDQTTDSAAVVDYEHKEVHTGDAFYVTQVDEVDSAGITSHRFYPPNTVEWMHFYFSIEAQATCLIEIREGISDALEANSGIRNRNRNFSDALSTMGHERQLAAATGGTVIWSWASGGATASARTPAVTRQSGEIVFKQGTKYEVRVTSGADGNIVSTYFTWYEHTNVEN
jgi:hypothetical protein